jgi:hypothetical protein
VALVFVSFPLHAGIIYVDPSGGGDVLDIPDGVLNGGVTDTVLVAAGIYEVSPDAWPIPLHGGSPTIMSESGAAATIIQGDGTTSPFRVAAHTGDSRVRIVGFTIRDTPAPILNQTAVTAEMLFTDNVVEDNATGVDVRQSVGLVARNVFQRNGQYALSIYHFDGVIESNEICGNAAGIRGVCCENPEIRQNHIHHNDGYGIRTGFTGNITYNLIEHNGSEGIRCSCTDLIERNVIRWNAVGVYAESWAVCGLHENDIYGNSSFNVRCSSGFTQFTEWDATMNWWGTTDPDEIAESIWDFNDDPSVLCRVLFDPWCVSPGCGVTPVDRSSWGTIKAMFR